MSAANRLLYAAVDRVAANVVGACDVVIGMSQMSAASMQRLRRRFGARTVLERGSRHIVSQREILESIPGRAPNAKPVADWSVRRELAEYAIADVITVPSKHVERSFIERGVPPGKLFRNPYGVDLAMFPATAAPARRHRAHDHHGRASGRCARAATCWSTRGGASPGDGVRLLHVGALGDAPVPRDAGFEHRDAVEQRALSALLRRRARLRPRLARGRPGAGAGAGARQRAAGRRHRLHRRRRPAASISRIRAPSRSRRPTTWPRLAAALEAQLAYAQSMSGVRDVLRSARDGLSWREYGRRYDAMLRGLREIHEQRRAAPPRPARRARNRLRARSSSRSG